MLTHTLSKIMMICEFSVTTLPLGEGEGVGGGEEVLFKNLKLVSDQSILFTQENTYPKDA